MRLSTNSLVETFEAVSGLPGTTVAAIQRYLREARMLPASGRTRSGPQNLPVHGAVLIAAALIDAPILRVADVLPQFWITPSHFGPLARYWKFSGSPRNLPTKGSPATVGQVLELLVRAPYHSDLAERAAFREKFHRITIQADAGRIILEMADRIEQFGFLRDAQAKRTPALTNTRSADASLFVAMADVAEENRQAALQMGFEIPTAGTYAALGAKAPHIEGIF